MTNLEISHEKMTGATFRPGVYDCYTNADYHAHAAISKSGLDLIHRSPAHYKAALTLPHDVTPAFMLGTALHTAILEPERFAAEYVVIDGNRRLKAVQEEIKAARDAGKVVMSAEEAAAVEGMRDQIMRRKIAATLLTGALKEHSVFGVMHGVRVKCRPDGWRPKEGVLIDLKTTLDASPRGFAQSAARYRYHVQDAYYRHVVASVTGDLPDKLTFVFIAVENKPPYEVAMYSLDEMAKLQGESEYREDLRRYAEALETDQWGAYSPIIETLSLPRWAVSD